MHDTLHRLTTVLTWLSCTWYCRCSSSHWFSSFKTSCNQCKSLRQVNMRQHSLNICRGIKDVGVSHLSGNLLKKLFSWSVGSGGDCAYPLSIRIFRLGLDMSDKWVTDLPESETIGRIYRLCKGFVLPHVGCTWDPMAQHYFVSVLQRREFKCTCNWPLSHER